MIQLASLRHSPNFETRIFVISASRVSRLSESLGRTREQVFARSRVFEMHYSSQSGGELEARTFGKVLLAYEQVARLENQTTLSVCCVACVIDLPSPSSVFIALQAFFARSNQLHAISRFVNFLADLKRFHAQINV